MWRPFSGLRNGRHTNQRLPLKGSALTASRHRSLSAFAGVTAALTFSTGLASCSTAPAVGPVPGSTVAADASSGPSTPPAEGLKLEINIDQKSVTPLEKELVIDRGRSVVLVTRSDHDTSLTVTGPDIDRTDFIGRLTTISTTFVVDKPGVVVIKSTDPVATIARLTVR